MQHKVERFWAEQFLLGRHGIRVEPYAALPEPEGGWHEDDPRWTLPDWVVLDWWSRMVRDGTVKRVFYNGAVTNPDQFIAFLQRPTNVPLAIRTDDQEWIGIAWLTNINRTSAVAHFCGFREGWERKQTIDAGELALDYWFAFPGVEGGKHFKVLLGITPADNRLALRFINQLGFERVGTVPHLANGGDAIISYITRESRG